MKYFQITFIIISIMLVSPMSSEDMVDDIADTNDNNTDINTNDDKIDFEEENTSDTKDDETSIADILDYGIESEIVKMIEPLSSSLNDEYMKALFERYQSANIDSTKKAIAKYYERCDNIPDYVINYIGEEMNSDEIAKDNLMTLMGVIAKHAASHGKDDLISKLLEFIDSTDRYIQDAAVNNIKKIKDKDVSSELIEILKKSDEGEDYFLSNEIKQQLILALGEFANEISADYLTELLENEPNDKFIIMYSLYSLAKIGKTESLEIIKKHLAHGETHVQEYAAYALSEFISPEVLPSYKSMLRHNNPNVRAFACKGIANNEDISAINALMYKIKNDPEKKIRNEALSTLVQLGTTGIDKIKTTFKPEELKNDQLAAITSSIVKNPTSEGVNFLLDLINSGDKDKIKVIAQNLASAKSNLLDPILEVLLKSDEYSYRLGAINLVFKIENTGLWPVVKEISENDPVKNVRKHAKKILDLKDVE